ncbi:MAG: ABC transporter substrate-binding protein [Eubacteriales bacterium]|nr:ABC transporter substrate-binding protein [Eubacteriales bacterium]
MYKKVLAGMLSAAMLFGMAGVGGLGAREVYAQEGNTDPYKIGVFLRFSDEAGTKMQATIDKAFEDINEAGGINGHELKIIEYDTEGDSTKAIDAFNRLISEDEVLLAIGPTTSSCALAVIDMAKDYGISLITPQATNTDITAKYGNEWFFRNSVADIYHSYTLCDYVVNDMKAEKIAIVHETGTLGLGQYENFVERLKSEYDMEPVIEQEWNEGDVDFKTQLLAVKNAEPDVIIFAGHEAELAIAVSQRLDVGISKDVPICGFSSMSSSDYYNVAGDAAVGSVFVTTFSPSDEREDIQKFVEEYKDVVPAMDHNSAQAYDTVQLVADVMDGLEIGNTSDTLEADRTLIRDALAEVKDWKGLTGVTTFGPGGGPEDRDGKTVASVYQLQDDFTWTCLKEAE